MKKIWIFFIILILAGCGMNTNPSINKYDCTFKNNGKLVIKDVKDLHYKPWYTYEIVSGENIVIKCEYKSKPFLRTEYYFETLVIEIDKNLEINKEYDFQNNVIKAFFLNGSQIPHMLSFNLKGTFKIIKKTQSKIVIEADFTLFNPVYLTRGMKNEIRRKGEISAGLVN